MHNLRLRKIICFILAVMMIVLSGCKSAAADASSAGSRKLSHIRIGCFNSGEYFYYQEIIDSLARELQRTGYISGYDEDKERHSSKETWLDLCSCSSEYLEFIADEYYEKYYMDEDELEKAAGDDNVDLMLAVGSLAGAFLTENADKLSYDYMVVAVADPISAGIVAGPDKRVNDKSFAIVDTKRMSRQIEAAYELFHFRSVGVVYEDTPEAYSYSGIGQLEEAAQKYGFEIHKKHVKEAYDDDYERYYTELKKAYEELIPDIDMLYITTATIEDDKLPWLLEDVTDAGIITVAETSESQVEYGALMHITMSDSNEDGQFIAARILDYAGGTPITDLDMVFEIAPKICLNRTTIEKTGVKLPLATYLIADKVYE